MVQRPREHFAVWHFWDGPERAFSHWYINLQTAFRRSLATIETQDLEVDFVVNPDGAWKLKDWDLVDDRVAEERFTPELAAWIRKYALAFQEQLAQGDRPWDTEWQPGSPTRECCCRNRSQRRCRPTRCGHLSHQRSRLKTHLGPVSSTCETYRPQNAVLA
jgi:Protein of unknown function (DUF402)